MLQVFARHGNYVCEGLINVVCFSCMCEQRDPVLVAGCSGNITNDFLDEYLIGEFFIRYNITIIENVK